MAKFLEEYSELKDDEEVKRLMTECEKALETKNTSEQIEQRNKQSKRESVDQLIR